MAQLNIFDEIVTDKANKITDDLNEGLKKGENYYPIFHALIDGMIILFVMNNSKNVLCNVIDHNGDTPVSFSANWRSIQHLRQELNSNQLERIKNSMSEFLK